MSASSVEEAGGEQAILNLRRPVPALLKYNIIVSFFAGPFFFIPLLFSYIRYRTLEYSFDDEGVSMSWGRLMRRHISLTYPRVQDINLHSNVIERWLGLARVELQTASGSSGAEMVIVGVPDAEALREFLYRKMRGVGGDESAQGVHLDSADVQRFVAILNRLTDTLQKRTP